ncbi:DUF6194 family protein [Rhodococcus chondri]|uniref:DUF6194 family protein n=1 Tax=Rhodococcus chondri TaxID=3065941 RepID=A0ABU7JTC8_9NOCA|nr:DUF6194 family protein [Rhodococcus sp. CC-R104]MEE2032744.1 DUF6194 family protein [Rhodococcus sp. CC-R104]
MTRDEIIDFVRDLDGVLLLRPEPGDGSPDIAWGDTFIYYAPDGAVPTTTQPFATIVTKNYPGDESSRLDRPDTFRVNIAAGKDEFLARVGRAPRDPAAEGEDASATDTLMAHPVYGTLGWLAVVNPAERTEGVVRELLRRSYDLARNRYARRIDSPSR